MENGESKPRITAHQVIWVVAWVVVLTILFLVGAWLFRPPKAPEVQGANGLAVPGKITEMETAKNEFTPEGNQLGAASGGDKPPASLQGEANKVVIPPPRALAGPPTAQSAQLPPQAPAKDPPPATRVTEKKQSSDVPPKTSPEKGDAKKEEIKKKDEVQKKGKFYLQVGAFGTMKSAEEVQKSLAAKGFKNTKIVIQDGKHKVVIRGFKDRDAAIAAKGRLASSGFKDAEKAFPVESE